MNVYIVEVHTDYEGFEIDSVWCSSDDAEYRAQQLQENSRLPIGHPEHEFAGDDVSVSCYEAKL